MNSVEARLKSLPSKVGTPIERLLAAGQLNDKVVETALDAGELARDNSRLLAFVAGMLYLQSQGIAVHDVIEMAKKQSRRINLGWSAKRWKAEHERLSQAETMARLSQQNVGYDISKFTAYLPECFNGYLIKNSRRLGMEGLRQRHCVASYHQQLLAGHCAIASVFVDKRRWTVQLVLTGNNDVPLCIVQCRTRHNRSPSAEVLNRIHELLNVKRFDAAAQYSAERSSNTRSYMQNLRALLPVLRERGVQQVTVQFDGSGDSGSIDSTYYEPQLESRGIDIQVRRVTREFVQGEWRYASNVERLNLDDAIEEVANDYLEETGVDWYNNDGGFGELVIDVTQGTVALEINVRMTESETAYSGTKDIETGEER